MTVLPDRNHLAQLSPSPTQSEFAAAIGVLFDVVTELPGGGAGTELTIAAGSVTPTAATHHVDTEGDAVSDDLANIVQTNVPEGRWLLIRAASDARTVVIRHAAGGAGQILTRFGADFVLDGTGKWLLLVRRGTDWEEVFRSYGADGLAALDDLGAFGKDTRFVPAEAFSPHPFQSPGALQEQDWGQAPPWTPLRYYPMSGLASETLYANLGLPGRWNGGQLEAAFLWAPTTDGGATLSVDWRFYAMHIGQGETLNEANANVNFSDTVETDAWRLHLTQWVANPIPAAPTDYELVRILAVRTGAGDTYNEDAAFLGMFLRFKEDRPTDDGL